MLLGAGVPLYATDGMTPVNLEQLSSRSVNCITSPRYRVRDPI